jgi:hypothetical protein
MPAAHSGQFLTDSMLILEINNPNISDDTILLPSVEVCEGDLTEEGSDLEDPCHGLEIVEQSALDHFHAVLQKAQRLAAEAENVEPGKHKRKRDGKSERTLRRHTKRREDLAKQGYLSVFDFIAHVKEKRKTPESKQVSDKRAPEMVASDSETLVSKLVNQVRCRNFLMWARLMDESSSTQPGN